MILPLLLALQVTPTPKLPPANPLPPPVSEESQVLVPVNALLAAIGASDGAAALAQARPDGTLTAVVEQADGTQKITRIGWTDFTGALKPGAQRYEERIFGPAVEIDGGIAMVWAPYVFLIDGKPNHCGTNHFDMVRDGGKWRVLNITWTQRKTGCDAYLAGK